MCASLLKKNQYLSLKPTPDLTGLLQDSKALNVSFFTIKNGTNSSYFIRL